MTAAPVTDQDQRVYWESEHGFRSNQHPIVRFFATQRWRAVLRHMDRSAVREVLDVGCGDGFSSLYAPEEWTITCCDASLRMLKNNPSPRKALADACNLPFADSRFDLVNAWELLHHMEEPQAALAEMRRVTRRYALVFEPNPYNPAQLGFSFYDKEHAWVRRNTFSHLPGLAREAGFRIAWKASVGLIFPNKTPGWLFALLKRMPFRIPLVGISHVLLLEKDNI